MSTILKATLGATALTLTAGLASAATIDVTITNNQSEGGLYLTPLFTAFHDGTYDPFNAGEAASGAVELLAEEGSPAALIEEAGDITTAVITSPGGFAGAPVIDPGEVATLRINLNAETERFLTFLSMVIPSNDTFIGNDNATAYELFDADGNFTNLGPISVFNGDAWDAGTEVNDNQGAAFNAAGGVDSAENGLIALAGDLTGLSGQTTAAGTVVTNGTGAGTLLSTIEVAAVPLPAGAPLLLAGLGALGFANRRRKS